MKSLNKTLAKLTLGATMLMSTSAAFAQIVTLGQPTYSGTGCPDGTLGSSLSPDGSSLSILFDNFVVQAGGTDPGAKFADRKFCTINLTATAPAGYRIRFLLVDYRGFAELGQGGDLGFTAEHLFGDPRRNRPVRTIKRFTAGYSGEFLITHPLDYYATPCGGTTQMSFTTSLLLYARAGGHSASTEVSMSGLDSGDISNQPPIFVQLGLDKCQ